MNKIYDYFKNWDPMGFISEDEAPEDEYNVEATEVYLWFSKNQESTSQLLGKQLHKIFVDRMGIDPPGFKGQCEKRSPEILEILRAEITP